MPNNNLVFANGILNLRKIIDTTRARNRILYSLNKDSGFKMYKVVRKTQNLPHHNFYYPKTTMLL